jgi:hypothetical protein
MDGLSLPQVSSVSQEDFRIWLLPTFLAFPLFLICLVFLPMPHHFRVPLKYFLSFTARDFHMWQPFVTNSVRCPFSKLAHKQDERHLLQAS